MFQHYRLFDFSITHLLKNKKFFDYYLIIGSAFVLAILFFFSIWYGYSLPKPNYQIGQVSPITIRAPIAFNILKSDQMLELEVNELLANYPSIYTISEEISFNAQKQIDIFFQELNLLSNLNDTLRVINKLNELGYKLDSNLIFYLNNSNNRNNVYTYLSKNIARVMALPIINDEDDLQTVRINDKHKGIINQTNDLIRISEAKELLLSNASDFLLRYIIRNIGEMFLQSNLVLDEEAMILEKQNLKNSIDAVITRVDYNEFVITKNKILTEADLLKIDSLSKALIDIRSTRNNTELLLSTLGQFLINIFLLSIFYFMTKVFYSERFFAKNKIFLLLCSFIISAFLTVFLFYSLNLKNIYLIPLPMFILVIAVLFSPIYAVNYGFFSFLIISKYIPSEIIPLTNLIISSLTCILLMGKRKQVSFLYIFIYLLSSLSVIITISSLFSNHSLINLSLNLLYSTLNCVISILGAHILIPLLENKFSLATKNVLLALLDNKTPLLKRLSKEAPGTYYHSLTVGILAEECAEAIAADSMIARVGSYYHDIGKLEAPQNFIENSLEDNIHNTLSPIESAKIIINHIQAGILLAKKSKLPQEIIEIIQQHHGTGKAKFFVHKATELGIDFNIDDFTYPGPKPQTKEAAIVMIADIIESTIKSTIMPSESIIQNVIEDTICFLLDEGQLNETPLTFNELRIIKQTIFPLIISIHKKRIEYPEDNTKHLGLPR